MLFDSTDTSMEILHNSLDEMSSVDMSGLENGVYFLVVHTDKNHKTHKVIK